MSLKVRRTQIPALGKKGMYYVYHLRYPNVPEYFGRNAGRIFYVGKGKGDRVFKHEAETRAILGRGRMMLLSHKHKVILEIWRYGFQVVTEIVGRTDDEELAYQVESMYIRDIGLENLTNATYGRRPRKKTLTV